MQEVDKSSRDPGANIGEEGSLKSREKPWGGRIPHIPKVQAVKAPLNPENSLDRVQTIHPDVTSPSKQIFSASDAVRNEVSRLVQQPMTSVSAKLRVEDASLPDEHIRQQIPVDPERDAGIYELKNYAYLRPEEIKETRKFPMINEKSKED